MYPKWLYVSLVGLFLFICGCETAKGLKKDAQNTWHNAQGFDDWVKEHLW